MQEKMKFDLSIIDWDLVAKALASVDLPDFDRDEVSERIVEATKRYAPYDTANLSIQGIEERFEFERGKGFIDLWGFEKNITLKIVDWKTTGSITDAWEFRESNSEQGLWYVHALKSLRPEIDISNGVSFEIRGVSRSGGVFKSLHRKISLDEILFHDVNQSRWMAAKDAYIEKYGWNDVYGWPRAFPSACRPFGPKYPCEFYEACENNKPRLYEIDDLPVRSLNSYSSEKEFQRCPERYRNLALKKTLGLYDEDEDLATLWGKAFHAGCAEVWRQLKELKND